MKRKKTPARRMGAAGSATRSQLVQEAMKLVLKEGIGAVTARRLAEKLGLKRQIVHYYFSDIDELLIAVIKRNTEEFRDRLVKALQSGDPLSVIWQSGSEVPATVFEFTAISLRNKAIQTEFGRHIAEIRKIESVAISRYLEGRGISPRVSPAVVATLLSAVSHVLSMERRLGALDGHAELRTLVDSWIESYIEHGAFERESHK
jgi:AcrR family transcriptional regulator